MLPHAENADAGSSEKLRRSNKREGCDRLKKHCPARMAGHNDRNPATVLFHWTLQLVYSYWLSWVGRARGCPRGCVAECCRGVCCRRGRSDLRCWRRGEGIGTGRSFVFAVFG